MTSNEETPEALAIQLVRSADRGNYCVAYDLKGGEEWKRFSLPGNVEVTDSWIKIFKLLSKECPAKFVKSIFLNMTIPEDHRLLWLTKVKAHGKKFGYMNFHWTIDATLVFTAELLLAKKQGKKYHVGDHVVVIDYTVEYASTFIIKKQRIGWDIVDGKITDIGEAVDNTGFLRENFLTVDSVKNVIVRINDGAMEKFFKKMLTIVYPPSKLIYDAVYDGSMSKVLEPPGEYLAKIYAGEEYFNDYDCYLGSYLLQNLFLQCGSSKIMLPVKFKRVPFVYKRKIKFTRCNKVEILESSDHLMVTPNSSFLKIFESTVNLNNEVGVLTIAFDEDQCNYFKLEKDDEKKTLIVTSVSSKEWKDDRPTFVFGKDDVSVDYFKAGLLWKLKDINGSKKIPFKISFDKEVYVGSAALEHSDFLMPDIDLEALSNVEDYPGLSSMFPDFILDDDKSYKILLKTKNGLRKARPENIVAVFIKSILKLLEEKLGKPVDEILVKYPNDSSTNSVISNACHFLKIFHENVTN